MNFLEALRTGKPIRRKSWVDEKWTELDWLIPTVDGLDLKVEAILAQDWEVDENCKMPIDEAVENALKNYFGD